MPYLEIVEHLGYFLALCQVDLEDATRVLLVGSLFLRSFLGGHFLDHLFDLCRRADCLHFWISVDFKLVILAPVDHALAALGLERRKRLLTIKIAIHLYHLPNRKPKTEEVCEFGECIVIEDFQKGIFPFADVGLGDEDYD